MLFTMFLAARYAFGQVMENEAQVFAAALLIEASMIVEAVTIVRARAWKANIPALIGLIVSILVSGTYNYVQVQHAGKAARIVDTWQLTATGRNRSARTAQARARRVALEDRY